MFPEEPFLQEEALVISKGPEKEKLIDFTATNRWLEKWTRFEVDEVCATTK